MLYLSLLYITEAIINKLSLSVAKYQCAFIISSLTEKQGINQSSGIKALR